MPDEVVDAADEDQRVIELLRTPGLSIKYLDEETKEKIRRFINRTHIEKGMSLSDMAKLIGNKTSGYTSWLTRQLGIQPRAFEEARLKGIHEKVRKYVRTPFNGTEEDRAYLLGLRHGDLSVTRPFGDAIRVSTSSTRPAMIELFTSLFAPYGHVYLHPREKKEMGSYEWNLSTILDNSFSFLLQDFHQSKLWIEEKESRLFSYLSGFLDAEGSIVTTRDKYGKVAVYVDYNNTNKPILEWIGSQVKKRGYFATIRINKKKGERTKPHGIMMNSDYWQLSIYGVDHIRELVAELAPRHREKIQRKKVAMSTWKGQDFELVSEEIRLLRSQIKAERDQSVLEAERVYKAKHDVGG